MSNEITVYSVQDIERMADAVVKSKMFGMENREQAMALMLISHAEGRHPALAAQDYHIINNRPSKKAEAMMRDFQASGGKVEWHALSDEIADATFTHPAGGSVRISWNMERAQKAGITGNANWNKYRRAMLRSRCVSEGCKTVFPRATSGMYTPEEQEGIPEKPARKMKDITPETPAAAPPPHDAETGEIVETASLTAVEDALINMDEVSASGTTKLEEWFRSLDMTLQDTLKAVHPKSVTKAWRNAKQADQVPA